MNGATDEERPHLSLGEFSGLPRGAHGLHDVRERVQLLAEGPITKSLSWGSRP